MIVSEYHAYVLQCLHVWQTKLICVTVMFAPLSQWFSHGLQSDIQWRGDGPVSVRVFRGRWQWEFPGRFTGARGHDSCLHQWGSRRGHGVFHGHLCGRSGPPTVGGCERKWTVALCVALWYNVSTICMKKGQRLTHLLTSEFRKKRSADRLFLRRDWLGKYVGLGGQEREIRSSQTNQNSGQAIHRNTWKLKHQSVFYVGFLLY